MIRHFSNSVLIIIGVRYFLFFMLLLSFCCRWCFIDLASTQHVDHIRRNNSIESPINVWLYGTLDCHVNRSKNRAELLLFTFWSWELKKPSLITILNCRLLFYPFACVSNEISKEIWYHFLPWFIELKREQCANCHEHNCHSSRVRKFQLFSLFLSLKIIMIFFRMSCHCQMEHTQNKNILIIQFIKHVSVKWYQCSHECSSLKKCISIVEKLKKTFFCQTDA